MDTNKSNDAFKGPLTEAMARECKRRWEDQWPQLAALSSADYSEAELRIAATFGHCPNCGKLIMESPTEHTIENLLHDEWTITCKSRSLPKIKNKAALEQIDECTTFNARQFESVMQQHGLRTALEELPPGVTLPKWKGERELKRCPRAFEFGSHLGGTVESESDPDAYNEPELLSAEDLRETINVLEGMLIELRVRPSWEKDLPATDVRRQRALERALGLARDELLIAEDEPLDEAPFEAGSRDAPFHVSRSSSYADEIKASGRNDCPCCGDSLPPTLNQFTCTGKGQPHIDRADEWRRESALTTERQRTKGGSFLPQPLASASSSTSGYDQIAAQLKAESKLIRNGGAR